MIDDQHETSTAFTEQTEATSIFDESVVLRSGDEKAGTEDDEESIIFPQDSDDLEVREKPSERLKRQLEVSESDSRHATNSISEIIPDVPKGSADGHHHDEARDDNHTGRLSSSSSQRSGPKMATDSYLESLHTRLESTHFRRDERSEDFIDYLFEKIELVACEMDGEKETLRDILDDTFEFLEDISCGRTAKRRNAKIRASFERFLQSFDKLAAIYPKSDGNKDDKDNSVSRKDLLDLLCDQLERSQCKNHTSNMVSGIAEYFSQCSASTSHTTTAVANSAKEIATATTSACNHNVDSLMSISEDTGELGHPQLREPLERISEEDTLHSESSRTRTMSTHPYMMQSILSCRAVPPPPSPQRIREECHRRNSLRRMRGNIHVNVSPTTVATKVEEVKESVEDAFEAATDGLATIFENFEMGIWDMLVLGTNSNATMNTSDEIDTALKEMETAQPMDSPCNHSASTISAVDSLILEEEEEEDASRIVVYLYDDHDYEDDEDRLQQNTNGQSLTEEDDPVLIHATSSEDTYASGCGSGHKGPAAKRFQMVDHQMKKLAGTDTDTIGRMTPNSHVTGSTCDETVSSDERASPAYVIRQGLVQIPSESGRLERMEMISYMSIHDRSSSERSHHMALSVGAQPESSNEQHGDAPPVEISTRSCPADRTLMMPGFAPRMEKAPEEISFTMNHNMDMASLEVKASLSVDGINIDEQLDMNLGKASNRSSRSILELTAVPTIEEVPSLPYPVSTSDETFATAQQSIGACTDALFYHDLVAARKARFERKSLIDRCPDDELHRFAGSGRKCDTPRPGNTQAISKINDSEATWVSLLKAILHGTKTGSGWVGEQSMKVIVMLLYVSATTAASMSTTKSGASMKSKFQEKRKAFEAKMKSSEEQQHQMESNTIRSDRTVSSTTAVIVDSETEAFEVHV